MIFTNSISTTCLLNENLIWEQLSIPSFETQKAKFPQANIVIYANIKR